LYRDLHGNGDANGSTDLPNEYQRSGLPDTSSGEYGLYNLVGYGIRKWRLQWCIDEQQHGSTFSLWRFYYCYFHVYE
jgi:hypothetical protein